MRLIDGDHLKKWILNRWQETDPTSGYMKISVIIDQIDREDRVDIVEVKLEPQKGKWIHHPEIGWGETWLCSECGERTTSTVMGKPRNNFCPSCGADMRGERNG